MGCTKVEISKERLSELLQAEHQFKSVEAMFRNYRTAISKELSRLHSTVDWASIAGVHIGKTIGLESEIYNLEVRAIAAEQESDQLKASLNSVLDALDGVRKAPRQAGHQLNHPDPKADRDAWRKLNSACDQAISRSTAAHDSEVIERALYYLERKATEEGCFTIDPNWLKEYADQLRQQAKEVQPVNDSCELECGAYGTHCRCRAEKAKEVQS